MKKNEAIRYIEETTDFLPAHIYPFRVTLNSNESSFVWVQDAAGYLLSLKDVIEQYEGDALSSIVFENDGIDTEIILPE